MTQPKNNERAPVPETANRPRSDVFAHFRRRFNKCLVELTRREEQIRNSNDGTGVPEFARYLVGENMEHFINDIPYDRVMRLLYYGRRDPASSDILQQVAADPCLEVLADVKIYTLLKKIPEAYDQYFYDIADMGKQAGRFNLRGPVMKGDCPLAWPQKIIQDYDPNEPISVLFAKICDTTDNKGSMYLPNAKDINSVFLLVDKISEIYDFTDTKIYPEMALSYLSEFNKLKYNITSYKQEHIELRKKYDIQYIHKLHGTILRDRDMEIINGMENLNRMTPFVGDSIVKSFQDGKFHLWNIRQQLSK